MVAQVGWPVAVQLVDWVKEAAAAAHDKREQRMARIIENAGILVAGLRHIDRKAHQLFVPLRYLQPQGWDQPRVDDWIGRLSMLAYEDEAMPRMRAALAATQSLIADQSDRHLQELLEHSVEIVEKTCHIALDAMVNTDRPDEDADPAAIVWSGTPLAEPLQQGVLPQLISLLRQSAANADEIQRVAGDFLDGPAKSLRALADELEAEFGRILAIQYQLYPALPAPTWVWADG
jgi:hypothetical protein